MSFATDVPELRPLLRFASTPKGLVLLLLVGFTLLALPFEGPAQVVPVLTTALSASILLDSAIVWFQKRRLVVTDGAVVTALIVALVLSPQAPLSVVAAASVIAIASKYLLRTRWSNVLNPAAVALLAASLVFNSGQSWWGALPDLGVVALPVLALTGVYVADRVNKLPLVLTFLAAYFTLFFLASFVLDPTRVAEVYRTPDLQAVVFFAFFMADDPPTSPIRYEDQIAFGLIAALTACLAFFITGGVYYLVLGLLVANVWESARRLAVLNAPRATAASPAAPRVDAIHRGPANDLTRSRWLR